MSKKNISYFLTTISMLIVAYTLTAQAPSTVEFGQNRVQYKSFKWQYYQTENFNIYFYQGEKEIGKYVILSAEKILKDISKKLDFRLKKNLDIIVYEDISDLRQSNIGLGFDGPIKNGQVKLIDNKLFIYFNGKHQHIDEQIKEGLTQVFLKRYITGSGIKETFKNVISASLPNWYINGLVSYNTHQWNTSFENQLKDAILSGRFKDLSKLSLEEMSFIGHSIWNYVAEKYGKEAVVNLMYLVKLNRSVDRGFSYVLGKDLQSFIEEWYYFYLKRFKGEKESYEPINTENFIDIPLKKEQKLYGSKLSPKGDHIAYLTNEEGKWKVNLFHIQTKDHKVLFKGGFRTNSLKTDLNNPMIAWTPRGDKLSVIYEKRDQYFIRDYDIKEYQLLEQVPIRKFQNIYDFSYAENSKNLIMSAMKKGQVDIFKYYLPSTKVSQITNDFYDDLQASYIEIEGFRGYLFRSNRPNNKLIKQNLDTILPNANFDIYFYDIDNDEQALVQITATPLANESFPQAYNEKYFSFLSDANGINNRYIGNITKKRVQDKILHVFTTKEFPSQLDSILLEEGQSLESNMVFNRKLNETISSTRVAQYENSGISYINSNYNNSISELSNNPTKTQNLELVLYNQKARLLLSNYQTLRNAVLVKNEYFENVEKNHKAKKIIETQKSIKQENPIDTVEKPSIFQSKFDEWYNKDETGYSQMLLAMKKSSEESTSGYKFSRTKQYFIKLKTDNVNLSLDNSVIVTPYQAFNPGNPVNNNNGLGAFISLGVKDLFENHRIQGGFRLSDNSFIPREFYFQYAHLTKRLDREYTYYRNSTNTDIDAFGGIDLIRTGRRVQTTNLIQTKLTYPFDVLNSLRLNIAYRNERTSFKSTGSETLNAPNEIINWGIFKLEYVHDNTIKLRPNTRQGFRANAHIEFQKEIPGENVPIFGENFNLPTWNNAYLVTWGADLRHYQKVHKTITWANRLAFASSTGTRRVVYYLGGSDGQLLPNVDRTNDVSTDQNYSFQSLAQQLRGLPQNTRNGSSYLVLNSELRIPVFSAFSKAESGSKLIESIEIIGFFDIGTAWEGFSPWGDDNISTETRFNTPESPENSSATVLLSVYKNPIVLAFGPGIRADIFGYFIKLDLGWGFDTGKILKPTIQASLTYDF